MKIFNFGACKARHEMPKEVEGYFFGNVISDVTDIQTLEFQAFQFLHAQGFENGDSVNLFATGLTVAVISAINAIKRAGGQVTIMHYDRASGQYYPQNVY